MVYVRPDSIGDLVLFTAALERLIAEYPKARHIMVVRQGYEALKPLFPAAIEWRVARLDPFKQRPSECRPELADLLAGLADDAPDLILAPTLNRTWLEIAVAAHFQAVRSVVLGSAAVDPLFASALRLDLGIDPDTAFRETVPANLAATDVENQHRLVEYLVGRTLASQLPSIAVPAAAAAEARAFQAAQGLLPGRWVAVFAGGLANVQVKAWPEEGFAELAGWIQADRKLPVLLMAHVSESAHVDRVAAALAQRTGQAPLVWLGRDGQLPLLAALLQDCLAYAGHDTGALHLAGALGRPVLGIYGGGHWPRFRPAARQAVAVVQPLPCFGCGWECPFGDAPCIRAIGRSTSLPGWSRSCRHFNGCRC